MTKRLIVWTVILLAMPPPAFAEDTGNRREWNFVVSLDGDPVGHHKFTVDETTGAKGAWRVTGNADFAVTLIGIPVFRYHHAVQEQWSLQCLSRLTADTDHDGDISHVEAQGTATGGTVRVTHGRPDDMGAQTSWTGCLMSFAYWNPVMLKQTQLLNPETGKIETVDITQGQDMTIISRGKSLSAHVWRLMGNDNPIDVLYDDKGNWIGLDATVKGGRILSYRLP